MEAWLRKQRQRFRAWRADVSNRAFGNRWFVLMSGLVAVAVPTIYTVFPELSDTAGVLPRAVAVSIWVLSVAFVVVAAYRQSSLVTSLLRDPLDRIEQAREVAGLRLLSALLDHDSGPLQPVQFRIFAYDADEGRLMTSWLPRGVTANGPGFAPGEGVVGVAYESESYQHAFGEDCRNDSFNLPPEQQERYADLNMVAAMPMFNARKRLIAVLSASSRDETRHLTHGAGRQDFLELAMVASRVWIDVLQLASD